MVVIKLLLVLTLAAVALTAPPEKEPIPIVSQESDVDYTGKYHYSYESGDGSKVHQSGELKTIDKDNAGEVIQGEFEYLGDDGKTYKITYIADENGYQPQGDHLPVAPEAPPLIARALAYLATAPPPKEGKN
ncbi:Chitin bind 4 domain containing protein [Asbolus verrucosus]|uniref:Chitin bind 4 domain containing protein n=1 Tax=Asbolus verrucosus TaxID=1661398 RepID=A0A482W8M8_ASBVE|nr:Chitin bind 4 domain containing protein [Asbolus verrucosus]